MRLRAIAAGLAIAACTSASEPGASTAADTSIVFGIDTEDFQKEGYNLTGYAITAKVDGALVATEKLSIGPSAALPHETRVFAPKGRPDAAVEIVVQGIMNQAVVVTRRARTRFVPGRSLLAYVRLEIRCNQFGLLGSSGLSGPTCAPSNETCVTGKCTTDELPPLVDYRADWATKPPSACGEGTTGSIVLGTGQTDVRPLADDETVTVECGPQGGHHLWIALSMKDLAQLGTTTTLSAKQPGGTVTVPPTSYPYSWSAGASGACELVALRYQLDIGAVKIADVLGKPLELKVDVVDLAGRAATATRRVNVAPERDGGPMCRPLSL